MRILYFSWPPKEIAGGIKMAFRHVEALCEAGLDAAVATPGGGRPDWFETNAPVVELERLAPGDDVLVLPENHAGMLRMVADWPNRKVVFCQCPYMAYRGVAGRESYADFGVSQILCVGRQTAEFCRRRFPSLPVATAPVFVDHEEFRFRPEKRLQIAFAPHKRPQEARFVRDLFRAECPEFRDAPWIELAGLTEQQVAVALGESAVYLSLCRLDAFSLSILEAFACGCLTAGFTGWGADDYATAANGYWAREDDCIDCATQLARAVRLAGEGSPLRRDMIEEALHVSRRYNRGRFAARLVEYWSAPPG